MTASPNAAAGRVFGQAGEVRMQGELSTGRLLLRSVTDSDLTVLVALRMDSEVRRFLGGPLSAQRALETAREHVGRTGSYAVAEDGQVVGLISLSDRGSDTELSFEFSPGSWGRGLAFEACAAVIEHRRGSTAPTGRLVAVTQAANTRSRGLLERLGMSPRDEFREFGALQVLYAL